MTLNREHFVPFYQDLTPEEDRDRTNVHYMLPPPFFTTLTGGDWHVYSCNVWHSDEADVLDVGAQTRAQERKLDVFAELLDLRPGMRLLDIGSGWGGPLLYLCRNYGVRGHGITLSERQLAYAVDWAARIGVDCSFELAHWETLRIDAPFDAVMTDEVIVHVHRLESLFRKVASLLVRDGVMVNKELHFTHPRYGLTPSRAGLFMNAIYGGTGNYRALAEELRLANAAGFAIEEIRQVPAIEYVRTARSWRANIFRAREELIALVGESVFADYNKYLMLVELMFRAPRRQQELHFVKCRKLDGP